MATSPTLRDLLGGSFPSPTDRLAAECGLPVRMGVFGAGKGLSRPRRSTRVRLGESRHRGGRQGGGRSRESDVRGSSTLPFGLPIARLTTSGPPRDGGTGTVGWPIPAAPPGRRPRLGLSLTG